MLSSALTAPAGRSLPGASGLAGKQAEADMAEADLFLPLLLSLGCILLLLALLAGSLVLPLQPLPCTEDILSA